MITSMYKGNLYIDSEIAITIMEDVSSYYNHVDVSFWFL